MTQPVRIVLAPGVLAFLPEYAGIDDPVAEVRTAARAAVAWLAEASTAIEVVGDDQGRRVGAHLLAEQGLGTTEGGTSYLVMANGSARRNDTAPGYVDDRAVPFDSALEAALRAPDPDALRQLDVGLAAALLVGNAPGLVRLGTLLRGAEPPMVNYADDPYGVQYWVMRWTVTDSEGRSTGEASPI